MTEQASRERGCDAGVQALVKPPMMFNIPDHNTYAASLKPITQESKRFEANPKMDAGDNIGGGSAGDSTYILAELLKQKALRAVNPARFEYKHMRANLYGVK